MGEFMNMKTVTGHIAATAAALLLTAGAANAADLFDRAKPYSMKDAPVERERPKCGANVALTTDYVFRGISQTDEGAAIQGGFDCDYRMFYAGVWASNIAFDPTSDIEIDVYGGIKHKFGGIEADLGVIYYAYPQADDPTDELDYVEFKFGLSGNLTEKVALGGTLFYSPDYTGEDGDTIAYEGTISIGLGTYGRFSPTFTALIGYLDFMDDPFENQSYAYWNAGVEVGFAEKFTLDLRYWDTDIDGTHPFSGDTADERFVATVSSSW